MTLLESKALNGIGGGGFEHINLSPGEQMKVPKGCVGVQSEAGKYTIIRPGSGAQLESQTVFQDERNLIVGPPYASYAPFCTNLCARTFLLVYIACLEIDMHIGICSMAQRPAGAGVCR